MNNRFKKYEALGYRKVPGFPLMVHREHDTVIRYVKSVQGMVFEELNIMKGEYKSVSLNGIGRHIHRLKGIAFIPLPKGETLETLTINHKDSDKLNNHVDNLEWVTYTENIEHAFENGLRNDNMPCVIRDIIEDKIIPCYSRAKAARVIGIRKDFVYYCLNRNVISVFHYRYVLANTEAELPLIHKNDLWRYLRKCPIWVKDMKEDKVIKLKSVDELNEKIGVSKPLIPEIAARLKEGNVYQLCNRYEISNITDPEEMVEFIQKHSEYPRAKRRDTGRGQPVEVIRPDGSVTIYGNLHKAAKALNVNHGALQKRMGKKYNGGWKGHKLAYRCSSKTSLIAGTP